VEVPVDEKDKPTTQADAPQQSEQTAPDSGAKKPYKSPTIKRHGNLRLMTQLE
jgi:hypothetical protein